MHSKMFLKKTAPQSLDYEFQQFKNEEHGTITTPTFHLGLKKIWSQWRAPKNSSLDELEKYYTQASVKYGFPIRIPLTTMNGLGYRFLQANQLPDAIRAFKKTIELYPDSRGTVDAYSGLAEAFEKRAKQYGTPLSNMSEAFSKVVNDIFNPQ